MSRKKMKNVMWTIFVSDSNISIMVSKTVTNVRPGMKVLIATVAVIVHVHFLIFFNNDMSQGHN